MEVFIFGWWWTSHQSLAHEGLRILRFCIMSWKGEREPRIKHCRGRQIDVVQKFNRIQSFGDRIDGEPMEFEWNIFPGFTTLELSTKVQELLSKLSVTPEKITGRIIFMSMFNDISCGSRDNEKRMRFKCSTRFFLCKEIWSRTMVIPRTWIREKVVLY